MTRRRSIVTDLMHEVILYGGLPVRRCDVYDHALRTLRTHIGVTEGATEQACQRAADRFAFGQQTRRVNAEPLTAAELARQP